MAYAVLSAGWLAYSAAGWFGLQELVTCAASQLLHPQSVLWVAAVLAVCLERFSGLLHVGVRFCDAAYHSNSRLSRCPLHALTAKLFVSIGDLSLRMPQAAGWIAVLVTTGAHFLLLRPAVCAIALHGAML